MSRYQAETGFSYYNLNKYVPIEVVLYLFDTLHEADRKFFEIADKRVKKLKTETNFKTIRRASGLTQSKLATEAQ